MLRNGIRSKQKSDGVFSDIDYYIDDNRDLSLGDELVVKLRVSGQTDQDAIIEQLSRINEQMAIRNRRANRTIRIVACLLLALIIVVATVIVMNIAPRNTHILLSECAHKGRSKSSLQLVVESSTTMVND